VKRSLWLLPVILLICSTHPSHAANQETLRPLVVWMENDPWYTVYGFDSPAFAIYDSGLVIYRDDIIQPEEGRPYFSYKSFRLDENALNDFREALPIEDFWKLRDEYSLVLMTNQPQNGLFVWQGDQFKGVKIYGDVRQPDRYEDETDMPAPPVPALEIIHMLLALDALQAEPWEPARVEVVLWPVSGSKYFPLPLRWPDDWPDLSDPTATERERGYTILLARSAFDDLNERLPATGNCVDIHAQRWAVWFRFPFPKEDLWMSIYPRYRVGF
jgi:hypothetical protein